ncbi:MAG: response regulator [Bacteroidota bacterium]|jgi:two-component system invasion response regulator UvrY
MKNDFIKVVMADDHILLRNALASLINNSDSCKVIAEASNGKELIDSITKDNYPDVAIIDLNMPIMDGYDTAAHLQKFNPDIKVLMLTMYDSELALIRLLKTGVKGFMKKDIHPKELLHAIQSVHENGYYYSAHTSSKLAGLFRDQDDTPLLEKITLTEGEIEFLKHVCSEQTYKEIAFELGMNPRAIDGMRDNLFNRLDVKSRVGLAMYAIRHGIVPI